MRLCAISIDLDEVGHYHAIHGLAVPAGATRSAVYDVGLPRLAELAASHDVPLTLFAVGADMDRSENAERLRGLAERGAEIGNHSLDHRYDLTRLDRAQMMQQVVGGAERLQQATGSRPAGFRAPGYAMTDELVDVLCEAEVRYDSSVFPCPAYYAAKAAKIAAMRVRGRTSRSIVQSPLCLLAPTRPYRMGRPFWMEGVELLELPVQVTPRVRLPFIGTALVAAGPSRARWLTRRVIGEPLVNLELHGIDGLDHRDGLGELCRHQLDLRIPVGKKLEALSAVVQTLRASGYTFVRLGEAADRFARPPA